MTKKAPAKDKSCHFCANKYKEIDYKDAQLLRRFTSSYARILPTRQTGICSKHQRKYAIAVKRARHMALLPFTRK